MSRIDWIPALGFGFLRRSTDYIHVVEGRYDGSRAGMTGTPEPTNSKTFHMLHYHSHPNTASPNHPENPETQAVPH